MNRFVSRSLEDYPEIAEEMQAAYTKWWEHMRSYMINEGKGPVEVKPYPKAYYTQKEKEGIPEWEVPDM